MSLELSTKPRTRSQWRKPSKKAAAFVAALDAEFGDKAAELRVERAMRLWAAGFPLDTLEQEQKLAAERAAFMAGMEQP